MKSGINIILADLEVFYRVGVTEAERALPQRLLVTVEIELDQGRATVTDELADTVDYHAVARQLTQFGQGRSWRLLEKLAADLTNFLLEQHRPRSVTVEVKKFVLPETRYVAVRLQRTATGHSPQPGYPPEM